MSEFSAVPSGFPGGVEVYEPGELPGAESVEIHHEDGRHGVHIRVQAQQDLGTSLQFQRTKNGEGGGSFADLHWFQCGFGSGPRSGSRSRSRILMTKNWKQLTAEEK
jgi:hypothetical protein